jgi:hypothetical protein
MTSGAGALFFANSLEKYISGPKNRSRTQNYQARRETTGDEICDEKLR